MSTLLNKMERHLRAQLTTDDCTTAFAVPGEDSIIDLIHPATGRSLISDQTLAQIRDEYPGAEVVDMKEWLAAKGARQDAPFEWTETTKSKFYEMLCVLPPAACRNGAFLVGEPWDHHALTGEPRYSAYRCVEDRYFASSRPMTRREFAVITTQTL